MQRIVENNIIVIGASAGGVIALQELLSMLPEDFPHPIAVVLHRSDIANDYLVDMLQKNTKLNVCEAMDKQALVQGLVAVAPAGYHLLIDHGGLALSIDDEVNNARPSIDVLMESAAGQYDVYTTGIILSGGGMDGVKGLAKIQHLGGRVLVQQPDSCTEPSLPQVMLDRGVVDKTYSIQGIVYELVNDQPLKR